MPRDPKYALNENDSFEDSFWDPDQANSVVEGINDHATEKISVDKTKDGTTNKVFTATEKTKLFGIEEGAEANTVDSVAGKTGTVTLDSGDVGLGNVDNTSDADKPVSSATQDALDDKEDSLGTPAESNSLLISDDEGVRSWLQAVNIFQFLTDLDGGTPSTVYDGGVLEGGGPS